MSNAMLDLIFWEGHCVESFSEPPDGSLALKLTENPDAPARCSCRGEPCVLIHARRRRWVQERDWLAGRTDSEHGLSQLWSARGQAHHLLDSRSRITQRLRAWIEALTQLLPIARVATLTGLNWHITRTLTSANWSDCMISFTSLPDSAATWRIGFVSIRQMPCAITGCAQGGQAQSAAREAARRQEGQQCDGVLGKRKSNDYVPFSLAGFLGKSGGNADRLYDRPARRCGCCNDFCITASNAQAMLSPRSAPMPGFRR